VNLIVAALVTALQAAPAAPPATTPATAPQAPAAPAAAVVPPADYVIGTDDVLTVVVWREKDLSTEVKVRPDGMVSLPLVNDVKAAGLTPEEFRKDLTQRVSGFVADPSVTVMVREINSRKVFITGEVAKPGPYPLTAPTTVLQLIVQAGGLNEYADAKNIGVLRTVDGKVTRLRFNYKDVARGRGLEQNILLKPGDTVIVP
jgi:polysaccharide export outer membrane protein